MLQFEKVRAKSQSWKNEGKIIIEPRSKGTNANARLFCLDI
jgi:hypothetical protein